MDSEKPKCGLPYQHRGKNVCPHLYKSIENLSSLAQNYSWLRPHKLMHKGTCN